MESKTFNWFDKQFKNMEELASSIPGWMKEAKEETKKELEKITNETERTITDDYFNRISEKVKLACTKNNWGTDWKEGGSYLHLEASEFVESLRGKKGTPNEEFADVMFVLISMMKDHNLSFEDGFKALENKIEKMLSEDKNVS